MFKQQFPFFSNQADCIYLDSAATTQKHESVVKAVNEYHQVNNAPVHRSAYAIANNATKLYEDARSSVGELIKCANHSQIIFNSGATESLNTIANGLNKDMLSGNKIVILASEHHANILPWQKLSKRLGLSIEVVRLSVEGQLSDQEYKAFCAQLNEDVAIVAMAHVSNALGNIYPVKQICDLAKQHNILSVIDGTQAIAHLPVDVADIGCDFYVFSAHKMYGPTGVGVLFGKLALLENLMPLKLGGEMISHVSFTDATYQPPPLKFEGGTPNIAGVIGLGAAARFLTQNMTQIQQHESKLYALLTQLLAQEQSIRLFGNIAAQDAPEANGRSIALHSIVSEHHNLHDLAQLIYQQNIAVRVGHHCAMPLMQYLNISGTLRISIACYTTEHDIQRFMAALKSALLILNTNQGARPVASQGVGQSASQHASDALPIASAIQKAQGWDNQYRQLLLASKSLKTLSPDLRTDANAVFGCESALWIGLEHDTLCAYSQSKIIRGILALILEKVAQLGEQSNPAQFDYFEYLTELNLTPFFSIGRRDGVQNAISAIKTVLVKTS